jgi:hypothetical protein
VSFFYLFFDAITVSYNQGVKDTKEPAYEEGFYDGYLIGKHITEKEYNTLIYETDQQYGLAIHELLEKKCSNVYKQLAKECNSSYMQKLIQKKSP